MGLNKFYFNDKSSLEFDAWVFGGATYVKPLKTVEKISVAGRNGDLVLEDNKFENVPVTYPVIINRNFDNNFNNLIAFLLSSKGYCRLEDDFAPDYFRMGAYYSDVTPKVKIRNSKGKFELTFDCKPQRWLKEGQKSYTMTNGEINNPTYFDAQPLIRAYGTGSFFINDTECKILRADEYTDIDCELMESFKGDETKNEDVKIHNYPVLVAGKNSIRVDGIDKLEIIPRWWTV